MSGHKHRVAPFMPEGQAYWEARYVDPNCKQEELRQLVVEARSMWMLGGGSVRGLQEWESRAAAALGTEGDRQEGSP